MLGVLYACLHLRCVVGTLHSLSATRSSPAPEPANSPVLSQTVCGWTAYWLLTFLFQTCCAVLTPLNVWWVEEIQFVVFFVLVYKRRHQWVDQCPDLYRRLTALAGALQQRLWAPETYNRAMDAVATVQRLFTSAVGSAKTPAKAASVADAAVSFFSRQ